LCTVLSSTRIFHLNIKQYVTFFNLDQPFNSKIKSYSEPKPLEKQVYLLTNLISLLASTTRCVLQYSCRRCPIICSKKVIPTGKAALVWAFNSWFKFARHRPLLLVSQRHQWLLEQNLIPHRSNNIHIQIVLSYITY